MLVHSARRLIVFGLLSEALYLGLLVLPFNLPRWLPQPAQDLGTLTAASVGGALRYLVGVALLSVLSWLAYRESRRLSPRVAARVGFAFAALFALTLIWIYPIDALDVFDYAMHGRILGVLGGNPYVDLPAWYPTDSFLPSVGWKTFPSVYGPLWIYLGAGIARLAGESLLTAVLLFKTVAAVASMACTWAVYRVVQHWRPAQAGTATVLLGWNPLVVLMAGTGHNDVAMMALALLGVWLAVVGHRGWGLWVVGLSTLVKLATLPFLPLVALAILRHDGVWRPGAFRTAALAFIGFALASVVLYAPLWPGFQPFGPLLLEGLFTPSPLGLLRHLLDPSVGDAEATRRASQLGHGLVAAIAAVGTWRAQTGPRAGARAVFDTCFWLVFLGLGWWQPWYVLWLACFAPLDDRPWVPALTWLASLAGLVALFDRFFLTQHWLVVNPVAHDVHTLLLVYVLPIAFAVVAPRLANARRQPRGIPLESEPSANRQPAPWPSPSPQRAPAPGAE